MKKIIFFLTFIIFISGFILESGCERNQVEKVTILFTNDLQGHILSDKNQRGGLARIAYLVKKIKAENPNTLLLDAGDASVGTAFTTETRGEAIYRVMNAVGYDASIYGNHEFDLGKNQARRYQEIAHFPILACNIQRADGKAFSREYTIFQLPSLKLAVIGVGNPRTPNLVNPASISELKFLPPELEIRRIQNLLADQVDMMIILSHQGIKADTALAYQLKGFPLIIGGHSEIKINGLRRVNEVNIAQAGSSGYWLGSIDFYWEPKSKKAYNFKGKLLNITKTVPEDPIVKRVIDQEVKALPPEVNRVIGKSWRSLSKDYLGYWCAELIKKETKADFGIINTGGVRSEIYRGLIQPLDIYQIMPFNDRICVFEIAGADLLKIKGTRNLYFSRGPKISPENIYKVGSIDFLLKINEFPGARNEIILENLIRDKMIEQVEKDRGFKRFWDK